MLIWHALVGAFFKIKVLHFQFFCAVLNSKICTYATLKNILACSLLTLGLNILIVVNESRRYYKIMKFLRNAVLLIWQFKFMEFTFLPFFWYVVFNCFPRSCCIYICPYNQVNEDVSDWSFYQSSCSTIFKSLSKLLF